MWSITGMTDNVARGYNAYEPTGKWVILSKSTKSLRTEYVVYDYYTKITHQYFRFSTSWMDCDGSIVYISKLVKAYNNYKKMIFRWLELYRYFIQFVGGKDVFTNIVEYYIEF